MNEPRLGEVAVWCGGELIEAEPQVPVRGFATDHRQVIPGQLFIAIRGARVDGHDFVELALQAGAAAALVERPVNGPHVLVADVVEAIARLGKQRRAAFRGPVIGITGSNGKTTTKEMVAAALGDRALVSAGNQNTEYTSPLTWLNLKAQHEFAVMEMAMRGLGQITHLAHIHQPTIGVITNIGTAHLEMVGSRAGIASAKGELVEALPADGWAILPHEDDFIDTLRRRTKARVRTFGTSPDADCRVTGYRALDWNRSEIRLRIEDLEGGLTLPGVGKHQALNAAAALLAACLAGVPFDEALAGLSEVELPAQRLEIRHVNQRTWVLDAYNASPDSTLAALRTLVDVPAEGERWAVLGEMKELGAATESGHRLVGAEVAKLPIQRVLFLGEPMRAAMDEALQGGFPASRATYSDHPAWDTMRSWLSEAGGGTVILIKGSRALELERGLPSEVMGA